MTISPPVPLSLLCDGPAEAQTVILLAHGAGAPMDSPFQSTIAAHLGAAGLRVVRFEFAYMARQRAGEGRRPPDREPLLLDRWRQMLAMARQEYPGRRLVLAGKSMGGRMAALLAAEHPDGVAGLIVLGYPFHPAGRPEAAEKRVAALCAVPLPTLVVQGERDALGDRAFVSALTLPPMVQVRWLPDGDHSFKPRRASGYTEAGHWREAAAAMAAFVVAL